MIKQSIKLLFSMILVVTLLLNAAILGISCIVYAAVSFSLNTVPAFSTVPFVKINNNEPYFEASEYTTTAFESYGDLDYWGRCTEAYALVCTETMPTGERGSISSVTPTGWVQVKYDTSLISGGYLYNRCHLIGWQLTGENANKKNLITGTRYLNIDGMLGFEDSVAEYVKANNGHVLYRVTPIFNGSDLLASGVLMEGYSVDDSGSSIKFCVYCYNAQPGITINYSTGESKLTVNIEVNIDSKRYVYVLNLSTKKYHTPACSSASKITAANKLVSIGASKCPESEGYTSCSICKASENGHLICDVDSDNSVTVSDARLILRIAINLDAKTDLLQVYSDIDKSGSVTVSDARAALRISIGLE